MSNIKKIISLGILLFLVTQYVYAQSNQAKSTSDTTYITIKKMSEADLAKKREGLFFTGIPDFSSDPVTGFGVGVRSNIIWNGYRNNSLFSYTPYLAKLKLNAAYYTSNARELAISLDLPYVNASRWRLKLDFKLQENPANLYFGITENTLGYLVLPSNPESSFLTYQDFDIARKTIRQGQAGEAQLVTDALSNRFKETELMLNVKADYALGNGKWRVMGGYEIQHLSYSTFENQTTDGRDPVTNNTVSTPNGTSLLRRDFANGKIYGLDGGWISILQSAFIYDTRDFEPDPSKGTYFEVANEFSSPLIGSNYTFNKVFTQIRNYYQLPFGKRTVLASRFGVGTILGEQAPFFEFQDQWSPDGSINALGGRQSLRGFRSNRFLARSVAFGNLECRIRLTDFNLVNQHFAIGLAPFLDLGTVRDEINKLDFNNIKVSTGAGIRIAWNLSTILSLDYGISSEDQLLYFGIGQAF